MTEDNSEKVAADAVAKEASPAPGVVQEVEDSVVTPPSDEIRPPKVNTVTPSRYVAIASLDEAAIDEDEAWAERTAIITKVDHEQNTRYARDFLELILDDVIARAK